MQTLIALIIVAVACILAICKIVRYFTRKGSGCSCGCDGCHSKTTCRTKDLAGPQKTNHKNQ